MAENNKNLNCEDCKCSNADAENMNKEYIDKHEAYLLLKQKAETYMLPATKEAYEGAARLIDSLPTIEVEPIKHGTRLIDGNEVGAKIQVMCVRREIDYGGENEFCRGMRKALRIIEDAPAVEAESVKSNDKMKQAFRQGYTQAKKEAEQALDKLKERIHDKYWEAVNDAQHYYNPNVAQDALENAYNHILTWINEMITERGDSK